MYRLRSLFGVLSVVLAFASAAMADPAEVIAKARAYLGGDEVLAKVRSLRYRGTVETTEKQPDGTEKQINHQIEIVFQKDYEQRIVLTTDAFVETTALDDYEGWHRREDKQDASKWQTILFQKNRVKQLRASTWENLAFFKGLEQIGGEVVDGGVVQIDGKAAHKLEFVHEPGIVYTRYFDPQSGKLLFTETDQGVRIREEGEVLVNGVRFPQRIINVTTQAGSAERVVTITIKEVTVNESYSPELFRVPLHPPR
jgi:hypothetical protein